MNESIFSRTGLVGLILSIFGGLILFQMARIQTSEGGQDLFEISKANYEFRRVMVQPERGNIYDRWGSLLAGNREVYEVGLNLIDIRNPEVIARDLSEILELKYEEVFTKAMTPFRQGKNRISRRSQFRQPR
jgi:cell division protein FtsI/penicillin-binding protein 2